MSILKAKNYRNFGHKTYKLKENHINSFFFHTKIVAYQYYIQKTLK